MTRKLGLRTSIALAATLGTIGLVMACANSSVQQCSTDQECEVVLGVTAGRAQCQNHLCQLKTGPFSADGSAETCESTAKCKALHPGEAWVCLKPGVDACVKLTSEECSEVSDNWEGIVPNSQPIIIGKIMPINNKKGDGTIGKSDYDVSNSKAVELARREFQTARQGFVVGANKDLQPIVTITCDTQSDNIRITNSVEHLHSLGVASVIMRNNAETQIALPKLVANKMFTFCTDCAAADYKASDTNGLLKHDLPDYVQSIPGAAKLWISQTEDRLRTKGDVPAGTNMRVLLLAPQNQVATLLAAAVTSAIEFNGKAPSAQPNDFKQITPSATNVDFAAVSAQIVAFKPHVIMFINGQTTFTEYMPRIESLWTAGDGPRPQYIMSPNEAVPEWFGTAVTGNENLRKRVTGLTDWQSEATFANYDGFVSRYKAVYNDENPAAAAGYEGFYLVANSTLAAVNDPAYTFGQLSGVDVARNFPLVVDHKSTKIIDTAPTQITIGMDALKDRQSIRQRGVYSEYDFDPVSGAQKTDIAVYCGAFDAKNRFSMRGGLIYRYETQKADGPFDSALCDF